MSDVTAIIPIKARSFCKTRLSSCLSEPQRLSLVREMLLHVLDTLQQVPSIKRIVVLTPERDQIPSSVETLDDQGNDLNGCLTHAVTTLRHRGCSRLLILPADLPNVSVRDVCRLLETDKCSIAPSEDERGTNGLCLPANLSLTFEFGDNSFYTHCRQMNALGVDYRIVRSSGLAFDMDTPEDYQQYQTQAQHKSMRGVAV